MLNVLQLISSNGYYGAERWVVALANNLDPEQVHTELAVMTNSEAEVAELFENFPCNTRLDDSGPEESDLNDSGLKRTGGYQGNCHRISSAGRFSPAGVFQLRDLIRARHIDIVHTHGYKSDLLGLAASRLAGVRCISTPHGFGSSLNWKMRQYVRLGVASFRFFDQVVPLSRDLLRQLQDRGVSDDKLLLIENAADLSTIDRILAAELATDKSAGNSEPKCRLGYVGRLAPGKQVDHLIEVFAQLQNQNDRLEFLIVGEGPERSRLESLAAELGCAQSVVFTGFVPNGLAPMSSLDIFLLASNSEGIPRCVMEAMALRLAVVAYDIPGVNDLVDHQATGLLVQLDDREALLSACRALINDKALCREFGENGRRLVEKRFSASRMARDYTQLYEKLMQRTE